MQNQEKTISASHFLRTVSVNIDNEKLTDKAFREFVRNTLPIVRYGNPIKDI